MSAPLPDAQARADALDLDRHVLVMAPAGSGKTGLLVHRLLRALAEVDAPEQVVAITFTNKAAAEIRARMVDALHLALDGTATRAGHEGELQASAARVLARDRARGWNLLEQPGRLGATTIDAFCGQIAAQLPLLSGLGGRVRVTEDAHGLYRPAITRLFEEIEDAAVPAEDRAALERVLRLHGNRLDRLVDPLVHLLAQREQWLAPAMRLNSDDELADDARALNALIEPALLEFESQLGAADGAELVDICREGAAHSTLFDWAMPLSAWPASASENLPLLRRLARMLLTGDGALRKPGGINIKSGFVAKLPYTLRFKALLAGHQGNAALERAAAAVGALPEPELGEALRALRRDWLRVLRRLAGYLRLSFGEAQETDFSELAQSALQALGEGEALINADHRIRHLLVDEMQDTSETQVKLIERITAEWSEGDGRSLFLVGDPQQSIYAFRKAEVRLFQTLWQGRRLGALRLKPLRLVANFRSQPAVVEWFNRAFQAIFPRADDILRGAVTFSPSQACQPASGAAGVHLAPCLSADEEAQRAAENALALVSEQRSVVVLARARTHLEPVIRALRALGHLPACQDIDPLAALPEVRDLLALARALWHPQDRLAWALLLRAPFVGLSWEQMLRLSVGQVAAPWPERLARALQSRLLDAEGEARLRRLVAALERTAAQSSLRAELADRVEAVWLELGGPACCTRGALDDVRQALICLREETRGGGIRDPPSLERRLAALYAAPRAGRAQVQLMTVHKAKGLEFDHVLLVGLNRNPRAEDSPALHFFEVGGARIIVPRPDEAWPEEHPAHPSYDCFQALHVAARRNESLRLLYVAVTRARRSATLYLSVEIDDAGAPKFRSLSFAGALEPVIRADVEALLSVREIVQTEPPAPDLAAPRAPRIRLDYLPPHDHGLYRPQEVRTLRPSEAVLTEQAEPAARRDEGDLYAQLVGTLFHEAMQRIADEGLAAWADAGASRRTAMAAGLRRRGMPEPMVESAVSRVVELLQRTLASAQGRWLLEPKPWARSEYPLAGLREGRWISAVIDRCFEDETGLLWVIDYKTSARAVPPGQIAEYVSSGIEKYREQVMQYAGLLATLRPDRRVRGALYFVEADRLETITG
ncbi:MAG: UvrD-helicase domain-containing protein [Panacagrimonas sp.]